MCPAGDSFWGRFGLSGPLVLLGFLVEMGSSGQLRMRGIVRIFSAALGAAFCLAASANAADAARAKPVSFSLAGQLTDRTASAYLAGIPFAASSGPVAASGIVVSRSALASAYGPPAPRSYDLRDFAASISLVPELALNIGYQLDDAGRFVRTDFAGAFDGLFLSPKAFGADAAPFDARATYVGGTWLVADDLKLNLGAASYAPQQRVDGFDALANVGQPTAGLLDTGARTGNSLMAGVSWDFSRWGGLDITASKSGAHDGLLNDTIDTTALDVSAHVKFGNGWVTTASYGEAITKLDLKPAALTAAPSVDMQHRTGYALAVAKHGVFGDDAIGLSVSQPATPDVFATVDNAQAAPIFIGRDHLLADVKPETDIEVGYVTTFLDGSLALQTNAAYQMNFAGQNGTNAVSLLSRAKIKF